MKFLPKSEDTRNFLKLKDGETLKGVFRGEFNHFRIHWSDSRSVLCTGKEACDLCMKGDKSKFRFRANFIVKDGEAYVAKVIEQGWNFYETLRALNEGDYELEKYVMKITRNGTGLHTSYAAIPAPNGLVNTQMEAVLSKVQLNNLGHITESEVEPIDAPPADLSDIPF